MDEVCQCLARRIFVQVPLDLRLDLCFPIINMSFKEDGVDALGEVGLCACFCINSAQLPKPTFFFPFLGGEYPNKSLDQAVGEHPINHVPTRKGDQLLCASSTMITVDLRHLT